MLIARHMACLKLQQIFKTVPLSIIDSLDEQYVFWPELSYRITDFYSFQGKAVDHAIEIKTTNVLRFNYMNKQFQSIQVLKFFTQGTDLF